MNLTPEYLTNLQDKELDVLSARYCMGWHIGSFLGEVSWLEGSMAQSADFVWHDRVYTGYTVEEWAPTINIMQRRAYRLQLDSLEVPAESIVHYYDDPVVNSNSRGRKYLISGMLALQDIKEIKNEL